MHCEVTVAIPAPAVTVWKVAQDPALRPKWDMRVAKYEVLGPQGRGTEVRITFRMGLLRPTATGRFMRWAPPHQSALQVEQGTSRLTAAGAGSWTFKEQNGETILTSRFTLQEKSLPWWISRWLYLKVVEWDTSRSFRRLRRLVLQQR